MNPQRVAVKFFAVDAAAPIELHAFIGMFHRFIQEATVEGLLIDVADYAHVPEGPGVVLIGHDVDYAIDLSGGRVGLLTTLKRLGEAPLGETVRTAVRRALVAVAAIESDGSTGLRFATDAAVVHFPDRLATPNAAAAYEAVVKDVEPVARELFGDAANDAAREHTDDERKVLAVRISSSESVAAAALLERLGSA